MKRMIVDCLDDMSEMSLFTTDAGKDADGYLLWNIRINIQTDDGRTGFFKEDGVRVGEVRALMKSLAKMGERSCLWDNIQ